MVLELFSGHALLWSNTDYKRWMTLMRPSKKANITLYFAVIACSNVVLCSCKLGEITHAGSTDELVHSSRITNFPYKSPSWCSLWVRISINVDQTAPDKRQALHIRNYNSYHIDCIQPLMWWPARRTFQYFNVTYYFVIYPSLDRSVGLFPVQVRQALSITQQ